MGRWVTSKGRRIYIPDEGEENLYAKKDDDISIRKSAGKTWVAHKSEKGKKVGVRDLDKPFDKEEEAIKFADTIKGKGQESSYKESSLTKQINKDQDLKEKQIVQNKKQVARLNDRVDRLGGTKADREYINILQKHVEAGTHIKSAEEVAAEVRKRMEERKKKRKNK